MYVYSYKVMAGNHLKYKNLQLWEHSLLQGYIHTEESLQWMQKQPSAPVSEDCPVKINRQTDKQTDR